MRLAVEPVGFPKTKVGKWKYPAIFTAQEIAWKYCATWWEEQLEYDPTALHMFCLTKTELEKQIEERLKDIPLLALLEKRITDDLTEVWVTSKGAFIVREFE